MVTKAKASHKKEGANVKKQSRKGAASTTSHEALEKRTHSNKRPKKNKNKKNNDDDNDEDNVNN